MLIYSKFIFLILLFIGNTHILKAAGAPSKVPVADFLEALPVKKTQPWVFSTRFIVPTITEEGTHISADGSIKLHTVELSLRIVATDHAVTSTASVGAVKPIIYLPKKRTFYDIPDQENLIKIILEELLRPTLPPLILTEEELLLDDILSKIERGIIKIELLESSLKVKLNALELKKSEYEQKRWSLLLRQISSPTVEMVQSELEGVNRLLVFDVSKLDDADSSADAAGGVMLTREKIPNYFASFIVQGIGYFRTQMRDLAG